MRLFDKWNVQRVVRLNKPQVYNRQRFEQLGVRHTDLYFNDGSCPAMEIVEDFIKMAEKEPAAIAVHCKAGLGRTGSLIGCYVMKHFKMPALQFIAWNRLCRPGSISEEVMDYRRPKAAVMLNLIQNLIGISC